MADNVKFLTSFRTQLLLLLTGFLLLTIVLVIALDNWARKRANQEVARQSEDVKQAVNGGFGDFAKAIGMAIQNLSGEKLLGDQIDAGDLSLPPTVEHIVVADKDGIINDTTQPDEKNQRIPVPSEEMVQEGIGDPLDDDHPNARRVSIPFTSSKGLYWIIIVTNQQGLTNKLVEASQTLTDRSRDLSNIRLLATTGVLVVALAIFVIIGSRFTRPIQNLADAAHRVTAGDLDFHVEVKRQDEVGQLATTFNGMITGLKSKRELEERLNQSERAAVIGRLTQSVAHEIRNPLNVINLSIDHASSCYAPEDEARRKQFTRLLASIKDEIERLNRLVSDLLNYGRPARLSVEPIDLRKLTEETLALVQPQADVQGVEVTIADDGTPAEILGDRERLKSFISNLAINALQAMPNGGHLSAHLGRTDGMVELRLADTGVGISEDAVGKIFEPYFSTKQAGFGLGLAVTKKIIEEHQGTINVQSALNRGTTFTVKLPAAT